MSLSPEKLSELKETCKDLRKTILQMTHAAASGHPGGSLSATEILAVLYFTIMKHDPRNPNWLSRDRVVISKGHATPLVYSILAKCGYYKGDDLLTFRKLGSPYQGHTDRLRVPGIEVSAGSLGHGTSNAIGMALGCRLDKLNNRIYLLQSDGELQEGSTWEGIMSASHYHLENLTAIVDRNRIQLDGWTEETMALEPIAKKYEAFGWHTQEIDGHDLNQIYDAILKTQSIGPEEHRPCVIIAHTVKGKGVSFMEDQVKWHGVAPNDEELEKALKEIDSA
ncbi:MAG: transketolase [Candidatus Melainabacteria bacterium]|nr:transketolase [Candidatus Melainabacteria bacterium]